MIVLAVRRGNISTDTVESENRAEQERPPSQGNS
jgi:hypothetical protein